MQHKTLVAALTKAGFKVEAHPHFCKKQDGSLADPASPLSCEFIAKGHGTAYLSWYVQEGFPVKEKLEAICVCAQHSHLVNDPMTDLFYGWFPKTIKQAVHHLAKPH